MIARRVLFGFAAVLWMGVIFYLSSIPDLSSGFSTPVDTVLRKCAHMLEYAVLFYLISCVFFGVKKSLVYAFSLTFVYSLSDEWHQSYVIGRFGSSYDVGFDMIGAVIAYYFLQRRTPPVGNNPAGLERS